MNYTQERTLTGKTPDTVEEGSERELELVRSLGKLMDRVELVTWGMWPFHKDWCMDT